MIKEWQQLGESEILFDGWRKVVRKTFIMGNGQEFSAEISDIEGMQAMAVIALTPENKVIVAKQYRVGPGKIMDELPGGAVDPGEEPIEAALRELKEETGYVPARITPLGKIYKHAWVHTSWHYFLAEECELHIDGQELEHGEEIHVELISIDQLISNAKHAQMTDTEAVFLAYEYLKTVKEQS